MIISMAQEKIIIGTRGSQLAQIQANQVRDLILAYNADLSADAVEIKCITTQGDLTQKGNISLADIGGKGLFVKEIELALAAGEIDLAVHSLKDVPTLIAEDFSLPCVLKRDDPREAFISDIATSIQDLPEGAVVGTSSLRRKSQAIKLRPDLAFEPFRGNVDTRLEKVRKGVVDATFLALCGLQRMGLEGKAAAIVDIDDMIPTPGQGAVVIETRKGDQAVIDRIAPLNHIQTELLVNQERVMLATLDGSCRTPIGGHCEYDAKNGELVMKGFLGVLEKEMTFKHYDVMRLSDSIANSCKWEVFNLGYRVGRHLHSLAGRDGVVPYFDEIRERVTLCGSLSRAH